MSHVSQSRHSERALGRSGTLTADISLRRTNRRSACLVNHAWQRRDALIWSNQSVVLTQCHGRATTHAPLPSWVNHVISSVRKRLPLITQLRTSRCTAAPLSGQAADPRRSPPRRGELRPVARHTAPKWLIAPGMPLTITGEPPTWSASRQAESTERRASFHDQLENAMSTEEQRELVKAALLILEAALPDWDFYAEPAHAWDNDQIPKPLIAGDA